MKQIIFIMSVTILFSCNSKKMVVLPQGELFEVIYQDEYKGAEFKFYEIITKPEEFKMLLKFDALKGKISENDILENNFLLLNMGEKSSGGFSITVSDVVEKDGKILIKVNESSPKDGEMVTMALTYPVCVVKIKSKKPIVFQ
jgi:hypothetical protein